MYTKTPLIRINWDVKPSGYAENPDNWMFLSWMQTLQITYIKNCQQRDVVEYDEYQLLLNKPHS